MSSKVRSLRSPVLAAGLVLGGFAFGGFAYGGHDGNQISACAANADGALRVVKNADDCDPATEVFLSWHQDGPAGPAGPPGPQGPAGPPGPGSNAALAPMHWIEVDYNGPHTDNAELRAYRSSPGAEYAYLPNGARSVVTFPESVEHCVPQVSHLHRVGRGRTNPGGTLVANPSPDRWDSPLLGNALGFGVPGYFVHTSEDSPRQVTVTARAPWPHRTAGRTGFTDFGFVVLARPFSLILFCPQPAAPAPVVPTTTSGPRGDRARMQYPPFVVGDRATRPPKRQVLKLGKAR